MYYQGRVYANDSKKLTDDLTKMYIKMTTSRPVYSKSCPRPCKHISVQVTKENTFNTNNQDFIELHVASKLKILRHVSNYDGFDLIVEVGSSLGLWIGLSALGIFDIFLEYTLKWKSILQSYGNKEG